MNEILYGKNDFLNILSVEPKDGSTEIFYLDDNKEVKSEFVSNKYWLLASNPIGKKSVRLRGNQHYKFGLQFDTFEEYNKCVRQNYRRLDMYNIYDLKEMFMVKDGYTYFKGLEPKDISVLSFDIESYGLLKDSSHEVYLISNTYRDSLGNITKKLFSVDEYDDEGEMLQAWCSWVRHINPTIMTGHNVFGYDLPYLQICADNNGVSLNLGRDGSEPQFNERPSNYRVDGSQTWEYKNCKIYGREIIDTMFLAVKYDIGRNFPSWALKVIIKHLGFEDPNRQHYDASLIRKNWHNLEERKKIKAYAIDDADDSLKLYDLMIPPYFYMCQSIPKGFQSLIQGASGSWLNSIFVRAYVQQRHSIPKASDVVEFEGAISYGVPGIYKHCWKADVASLYPSIMRNYKVFDKHKDPESYFMTVVDYFTDMRLLNKKLAKETGQEKYKALDQSFKILINSLYGFMGARGLNFNSPENAAKVTRYGREILEQAIEFATGQGIDYWKQDNLLSYKLHHDVITSYGLANCDTDSILVYKKDQSEWTKDDRQTFLDELNKISDEMIKWEDDGYYSGVIILKSKNYILKDFETGKVKTKGSSITDSKKEKALTELINRVVNDIFDTEGLNIEAIYDKYISEALDIKDITRWCTKKTVSAAVLTSDRTNEVKIRDALEPEDLSEGTKVLLFNDIEGVVQETAKGCPVFFKDGRPKMIENRILKKIQKYTGTYDLKHYLERVYNTMMIFDTVLDKSLFLNYNLSRNFKKLQESGRLGRKAS